MVQKWPVLEILSMDLAEKLSNRSCAMYLGAVQAPGLGKFCGQRTRVIKVFEKVQNFRKFRKFEENWCAQHKIKHLAWARFSNCWSTSLREFKAYTNLGGPAGSLGHPDEWPLVGASFRNMTRIASSYRVIRPSGKTGVKWAKQIRLCEHLWVKISQNWLVELPPAQE